MNNIEIITQEIRSLVPKEQFRAAHRNIYEGLTKLWAEELIKGLPENCCFEVAADKIIITNKSQQIEGFEKFVHDATSMPADEDAQPSFAAYLEENINNTHWIKFLQR